MIAKYSEEDKGSSEEDRVIRSPLSGDAPVKNYNSIGSLNNSIQHL